MDQWQLLLIASPVFVINGILALFLAIVIFMHPSRDKTREWMLAATVIIPIGETLAGLVVYKLAYLRPYKIDLYIYQIDSLFGYPGFYLGQFVNKYRMLKDTLCVVYGFLSSAILITFAWYLCKRSRKEAIAVAGSFTLNLFLAVPFYLCFPTCGPLFAFPTYPALPGPIVSHPIILNFPPNCIPSVHTSTALLIFWFLRQWRWGKVFGSAFLLLTILATLGLGLHYFFDILCAIPYAAFMIKCKDIFEDFSFKCSSRSAPIQNPLKMLIYRKNLNRE
jgi:hypothetical protein